MNKFLSLILALITSTLPLVAEDNSNEPPSQPVEFEVRPKQDTSTPVHRIPARINIQAYYNVEEGTLKVYYDGEAVGETFLYLNGNIIGYDSEINTSFPIAAPGLYKLEIVSDSWIAIGFLRL